MKLLTRTMVLLLALFLCFGATVAAATTTQNLTSSEPGDREDTLEELRKQIDELRTQNYNLLLEIIELEKALSDAEKDPTVPIPRRPLILITQPLMVEIEAGGRRTVEFTIQNLTNDTARAVTTTANLSGAIGIVGVFMDGNNNISVMGSRAQRQLSYQISVSDIAKEGFHTIVFNHEYLNEYNIVCKTESIVTIRVIKSATNGQAVQITQPLMVEVEAGSQRTIDFSLSNLTPDRITSVTTTADVSGAEGIVGIFTDGNNFIQSMGADAQRTFSYQINVSDIAKEGFHTIVFSHEYLNRNNARNINESRITVRVVSPVSGVSVRDIESSLSSVPQGQDFDLTAVIYNEGLSAIRDVSMTISDGMSFDGIYLRSSTNVVRIPNMQAGRSENISIGFTTAQRARSGAYPLSLELSYTDARGTKQTQKYTYFVNVRGAAGRDNGAEVIISEITYPRGSVGVGQEFEMTLTIKNGGEQAATNININAAADGERAIVPRSTSRLRIASLAPGEERRLSFRFAPTSMSASQNYVIGFALAYETGYEGADGSAETVSFTQYQGVNVFNPDDDRDEGNRISTPRIIVSDYKSYPLIVQAGQEFDLALTFLNTSNARRVRNIRVTLNVEEEVTTGSERRGSVFTPVGRSSTFFIDTIEPRGEAFEHIRFYTLPDAPPRNYIINVNFEYEDSDNNPFEARESIGINVKQVTKLDTSEVFIPDATGAFQPMFINFELYNTGRVTLSNLMIRIEGNFNINQSSVFYGSLSPGSMDFYDNIITPMESGRQEGAIVISYEDDTGELIEERIEFSVEVFEMDFSGDWEIGFPGDEDMIWDDNLGMFVPASRGPNLLLIIGIAVGALIVAGLVLLIVFRAKKKKRERMVDEYE